ncbi:MAG: leucine-rich repeat domain-containing protein [Clostridia bacterium]|nr:leucine-rich repeat domain-containing protein [Clostridia bacterium]
MDGVLYTKDASTLVAYPQAKKEKTIKIENTVTKIGAHAFEDSYLQVLDLPPSIVEIEEEAFRNCSLLLKLTMGNSVTKIGKGAFSWCSLLEKVELSNSLVSIGENAFYGCHALESITIPKSTTQIGKNAFCECPAKKPTE